MLLQNCSKVGRGRLNKHKKSCSVNTKDFITYLYPVYLASVDYEMFNDRQGGKIFFLDQDGIVIGFASIDPSLPACHQTPLHKLYPHLRGNVPQSYYVQVVFPAHSKDISVIFQFALCMELEARSAHSAFLGWFDRGTFLLDGHTTAHGIFAVAMEVGIVVGIVLARDLPDAQRTQCVIGQDVDLVSLPDCVVFSKDTISCLNEILYDCFG